VANAFDLAARQIGLNENDQRAAIQDYLTTGGANLDPATTAWCAAFVNATLAQTGAQGTGSNMARSFMEWGQAVDQPQRGDLAVFSRGDPNGPFGHVGFFDGYNEDGTIRVLGGNQGDAVSIANYSPSQLLGFRRGEGQPGQNALAGQPGQPELPEEQRPYEMKTAQIDPRNFMTSRGNALAIQPLQMQSANYLTRRL
jgi:uncharacterized protein (TIGR02594 family)